MFDGGAGQHVRWRGPGQHVRWRGPGQHVRWRGLGQHKSGPSSKLDSTSTKILGCGGACYAVAVQVRVPIAVAVAHRMLGAVVVRCVKQPGGIS